MYCTDAFSNSTIPNKLVYGRYIKRHTNVTTLNTNNLNFFKYLCVINNYKFVI